MKRESGIDLIRITGLFFVVGVHQFLYNGFYYEPQQGAWMWLADTARWLFFCCNGIFMMLTGYLRSSKTEFKDCYRGLIPVLLGYTICCCVIYPILYLQGSYDSVISVIADYINFGNYAWYVEMYIGLVLISPLINLALERIGDKDLPKLAGIMVFVTSLHYITALNLIPDYWSSLYPVTYYILGAVIRRLRPRVRPWQGIGMAVLISMFLAMMSIVTTDEGFSSGFTQGYGGFWTMLTAVSIFLGLYQVSVSRRTCRVLAWMAGGCFEGYLLSKVFDIWTYPLVRQWHVPGKYWLVFLCVTVPTFICTLILGKGVNTLVGKLVNWIPGYKKVPVKTE